MKNQPSRCLRTSLASMTLFLLMSFQAAALQVAEAQVTDAQIEAQKSPSSALQDNLQIPNTMEQRLAACSQCHGEYGYGNATDPNIPRLAEKPAGYLYKQLLSFKNGEGRNQAMEYVVRQLSPAYMQEIAQYYAAQRIPYQQYPIPELAEEVLARGELLAKEGDPARGVPACAHCHGGKLTGVNPMIPGVLNQPYDYMVSQLKLWRSNKRSTESTQCMQVVAKRMRKGDAEAVAAWLAIQPLPENREPISMQALPEELPGWCVLEENEVNL